jgi:hypothetical protein
MKTLGKLSDDRSASCRGTIPTRSCQGARSLRSPRSIPDRNLNTNQIYTFEACWSRRRLQARGSTDPKALADAIRRPTSRTTSPVGPGIMFNEKGQNDKLRNSAIQNRGGKLVTVAPKGAPTPRPIWPMRRPTPSALRPSRSEQDLRPRRGRPGPRLRPRTRGALPTEIYFNVARQRSPDRPDLWPERARPFGDLRRDPHRQLRPWRDDGARHVHDAGAVPPVRHRPAAGGAVRRAVLFAFGYLLQDWVVRRVAHLADHMQFLLMAAIAVMLIALHADDFRPRRAGRSGRSYALDLRDRPADHRQGAALCRHRGAGRSPARCSPSSNIPTPARRSAPAPTITPARWWSA